MTSTDDAELSAEFDTTNHIAGDAGVVSLLTKVSPHGNAYNAMLAGRRLAVSFQAVAELQHPALGEKRLKQLNVLLSVTLVLPHSTSTSVHYSQVAQQRTQLRSGQRPGGGAGDGDMWILSSALEYGLPLMSHDGELVALGRSLGHPVLTNLEHLRTANPDL